MRKLYEKLKVKSIRFGFHHCRLIKAFHDTKKVEVKVFQMTRALSFLIGGRFDESDVVLIII